MMKGQKKIAKTVKEKGITLIALVITIIVLLILAGVSIATLTGDNGILTQAQKAKEATAQAEEKEKSDLADLNDYMSNYLSGEPNQPRLAEGMTPVYWNGTTPTPTTEDNANNQWYNYVAGDNNTDSRNSKWANATTSDGSYWVWIPRYEYKILSGEGSKQTGKIEVKFIPATQTTPDAGYKIHPAFTNGKENNYANGEWDKELAGIWVAKFEMSGENAAGNNIQPGNTATLSNDVKLVSKPGVSSWRGITIGNSYTVCYNYDRAKESHLMKNSEWGAVAYLTHSQYGRNGNEININNSSSFITGSSGSGTSVGQNVGTTNDYTSDQGVLASSTGNVYGIYDLSGGAWERVAAYITNSYAKSNDTGTSFTCEDGDKNKPLITESTKYATVYPYDSTNDTNQGNYDKYKTEANSDEEINVNRYGDAVLETSEAGSSNNSWNGDYSYFPYSSDPFFGRGGYYSNGGTAGVFYFNYDGGSANDGGSFRAVLVVS